MPKYIGLIPDDDSPDMSFEKFRRPNRKQHVPHYPLSELFNEAKMLDKLLLAESRIVTAFCCATELIRGRQYPTYTFICEVGPRQSDLVSYVYTQHVSGSGGFVLASELPSFIVDAHLTSVARHAERMLLATQLAAMVSRCEIWYNEYSTGIWEIVPSRVDKHLLDRATVRLVHKTEQQRRREVLHGGGRLAIVH